MYWKGGKTGLWLLSTIFFVFSCSSHTFLRIEISQRCLFLLAWNISTNISFLFILNHQIMIIKKYYPLSTHLWDSNMISNILLGFKSLFYFYVYMFCLHVRLCTTCVPGIFLLARVTGAIFSQHVVSRFKPGSIGRAASALNGWGMAPAL